MSDQLPSIDNLPESELPSVDQFIIEEKELPSIDEFVEKEEEVTEEPPDNAPCSIEEEQQDLTEIVRLINDVRKDIPDIPEIKSYDEELERLTEQIEEVRVRLNPRMASRAVAKWVSIRPPVAPKEDWKY